MKCPKHPRYKGKTKPTGECEFCQAIYDQRCLQEKNERLTAQVDELAQGKKISVHKFKGNWIKFGVVSDTHLGSLYDDIELLETAYSVFQKEGVNTVYHCGDLLDGEKMYKGQEYEIRHHGRDAQVDYCVETYPYRKDITTYFITGNHDLAYWKSVGTDVGYSIAEQREDMVYLGKEEADILLQRGKNKIVVRVVHPGGGTPYAISYPAQKYINSLTGGEKPNVILQGHLHKSEFLPYRNVHYIQAGCIQHQTPFMRGKRTPAMMGFWIIQVLPDENGVVRFKQEWIPFYKRR